MGASREDAERLTFGQILAKYERLFGMEMAALDPVEVAADIRASYRAGAESAGDLSALGAAFMEWYDAMPEEWAADAMKPLGQDSVDFICRIPRISKST